jgi:hypothetical protein
MGMHKASNHVSPMAGNRNYSGSPNNRGSNGYYRSSSPNGINAYNLNFNSSNVNPQNNTNRAHAFSVRCFKHSIFKRLHSEQFLYTPINLFYFTPSSTMTTYDKLPVYKTCYDLLLKTYEVVKHFAREHKYDVGTTIKNQAFSLIITIYKANCRLDRAEILAEAREIVEGIKISFRLCKDLHLFSTEKYAELSLLSENISKQLLAWERFTRTPSPKPTK